MGFESAARPRARARLGVVLLLQLPHLHAAARIEGELHEAGGEARLRAQLLHAQLACLALHRVDEQVGLQRLVEGGEQLGRRRVLHWVGLMSERVGGEISSDLRALTEIKRDGRGAGAG